MPLHSLRIASGALLACAATIAFGQGTARGDVPPVDPKALFEWLRAGSYKQWPHESKPHPSAGPHPSQVITFLNPRLDGSLKAGSGAHPTGSAAVKELFAADGKPAGWAVSVKTQAASDAGKGWFWYEVFSTTDGSRPVAAGNGVPLCFGCHTPGKDFVLIRHPLK